jgi:hypothetical protein
LLAPGIASSIDSLGAKSTAGIRNAGISKKVRVGTGWQLFEGIAALLLSIAVTYWLFVSPSRGKRERQRLARELQDPRRP